MSTSKNGRGWMYVALALVGGGAGGGGITFMQSVSSADVSNPHATPYAIDRSLIRHQLEAHSELISALTKTMIAINDKLHEMKAALGRIEEKVDKR